MDNSTFSLNSKNSTESKEGKYIPTIPQIILSDENNNAKLEPSFKKADNFVTELGVSKIEEEEDEGASKDTIELLKEANHHSRGEIKKIGTPKSKKSSKRKQSVPKLGLNENGSENINSTNIELSMSNIKPIVTNSSNRNSNSNSNRNSYRFVNSGVQNS